MDRQTAQKILISREDDIRARGVVSLSLVGSVARGEAAEDSDIDVLIEVIPGDKFSLVDQASLRLFLNDLFDCETDVLIANDLGDGFRERLSRDQVAVF